MIKTDKMADVSVQMPVQRPKSEVKLKLNNAPSVAKLKDEQKEDNVSLQEAFKRYRKAKKKQLLKAKLLRKRNELRKGNPAKMAALRQKFINQAKKYFGYPYARKYWPPDSPEYKSPLFLDCCGLVRQVMRDLQEDFGFIIGPWNQAYMFDTLPIVVKREEDMKPGDLVFISGTYTSPKSKKQPHNMTHVEIWAGDGHKTIGARWNNGKVQYFDSYRFAAKSYYDETYYFRSIDTWLKGICRSHCKDHTWRRKKFKPSKKSIFFVDDDPDSQQNNQQDHAAADADVDADSENSTASVLGDIAKMKADIEKGLKKKVRENSELGDGINVEDEEDDEDEYAEDAEDELAEEESDESGLDESDVVASVDVKQGRISSTGNLVDLCNRGLYLQDLVPKGQDEVSATNALVKDIDGQSKTNLGSAENDVDASSLGREDIKGDVMASSTEEIVQAQDEVDGDVIKRFGAILVKDADDTEEVVKSAYINANQNAVHSSPGDVKNECGASPTPNNEEPIKLVYSEYVTDCVPESCSEIELAEGRISSGTSLATEDGN